MTLGLYVEDNIISWSYLVINVRSAHGSKCPVSSLIHPSISAMVMVVRDPGVVTAIIWHTANHCTMGNQAACSLKAFSSIADGSKDLSYG